MEGARCILMKIFISNLVEEAHAPSAKSAVSVLSRYWTPLAGGAGGVPCHNVVEMLYLMMSVCECNRVRLQGCSLSL